MELNPLQERDMGAKAERLANDPAYAEATKRLKTKILAAWEGTKSDQMEDREELFRMFKMLDRVTGEIEQMIADGHVAAAEIEAEKNG